MFARSSSSSSPPMTASTPVPMTIPADIAPEQRRSAAAGE
jgi:hypothetical protein